MADFLFVKTFDFNKREIVAQTVKNRLANEFPNLFIDWSHECGFRLRLVGTPWIDKDYGPHLNHIIQYHDSRQLRFHSSDGKIIDGLRFKDGIRYWSDDEVNLVVNATNQVIQELNL
jgi:hypothetical protein